MKKTSGQVKPVTKPFVKGNPTDERTFKSALGFMGVIIMTAFISFLVCTMINPTNTVLRVLLNLAVEALILMIFFNQAVQKGTDGVARGEILLQREAKGRSFSASEKAMCFHPLKGFLIGLIGTVPLLLMTIVLALTTTRQITGIGVLPGWMSGYLRIAEIGDPLTAYTAAPGIGLTDILRLAIRIFLMPFVAMVGAENRDGMLLLERLSPLLALLPAAAYGIGYLMGPAERTKVHTDIAQNKRVRARREKKARQARQRKPQGPQQLN